MVATSAGLASLRRSGLTLLLSRVGLNAFSHEMGDFPPNLLLRPGRFRTEMVFKRSTFSKMPYYRRAAKRPRYGKRDKYSIQQKGAVAAVAANRTSAVDIVPATTTEGMRKVKHLTVNLTQIATSNAESNLFWALVYVPQGTTAGALNIATAGATPGSMYEPNQFVMNCGVVDPSAGPIRMSSPISRNLNDGDKITLLIRPTLDGAATTVSLVVRYAITLN